MVIAEQEHVFYTRRFWWYQRALIGHNLPKCAWQYVRFVKRRAPQQVKSGWQGMLH